ncbi:cationic amino acid transporter 4-like [Pollicipes pollicipes]|uniref:cationic amino acid transporter 4-like n=1 Tax=Pollicipes pollicipes TaxID=41117 RepID=UPI00188501EB|nr:cationic amino acid transporter 4-like [Pollicipes pollicipes]
MERLTTHVSEVWYKLARKRPMEEDSMQTPLKRCLTTFDITLLGVGHMVGAGIYVLTGPVTRDIAGPAIIVSFLIAGAVSFLSALCFAEFASRVPKAGSTYVYTYITMGEFWAFLVGWNMVLDQLVGAASVARAWSGYVDSLAHGAIRNATTGGASGTTDHSAWAEQLDFLAAGVVLLFALLQAIGVRGSTNINSLFSLVNVAVMLFVSTYGLAFANFSNWNDFMPFGVSGVLSGASSCFFAYVGLDSMAIAAEEAKDPGYSVPRATFYAMGVVTVGYLLVTTTLTLMVPYNLVNVDAALAEAFAFHGVEWAQYLVSVAALVGMSSVLYGHMYTVPRYLYNMASDGLIFRVFSKVSKRTQVPVLNTFVLGGVSALLALVLDISSLVEFLSMGTLVGYSMVAMAVLMLRYRPTLLNSDGTETTDCIGGELRESCHFLDPFVAPLPYGAVPTGAIYTFTAATFLLSYLIARTEDRGSVVVVIMILFFATIITCCGAALLAFEQTEPCTFAVPFCPVVPLCSIGFNMVLLSYLQPGTWLRFLFWMMAGLIIYFCYGIRHSNADESWKKQPLSEQEHEPQWYGSAQAGAGPQAISPPPTAPGWEQNGHPRPLDRDDSLETSTNDPWRSASPLESEPEMEVFRRRDEPEVENVWLRGQPEVENVRRSREPEVENFQGRGEPEAENLRDRGLPDVENVRDRGLPEAENVRGRGETEARPGLRRQSSAETDSLPSLTYDEVYRTAY